MSEEAFEAREAAFIARAQEIQGRAAQAFERIVSLAETQRSGQPRRVAGLIASLYAGDVFKMDPNDLRPLDVAISDDVLVCLDAIRWGRCGLEVLIPEGDKRVQRVLEIWGIEWPKEA